jgi:hypothetical protein
MFRYVLSLTFAVSFATAATITTTATCDGVTTVGTTSASCSDALSSASASVDISSLSFGAEVQAMLTPPGIEGAYSSATANFSDEDVFTAFGELAQGSSTRVLLPILFLTVAA